VMASFAGQIGVRLLPAFVAEQLRWVIQQLEKLHTCSSETFGFGQKVVAKTAPVIQGMCQCEGAALPERAIRTGGRGVLEQLYHAFLVASLQMRALHTRHCVDQFTWQQK